MSISLDEPDIGNGDADTRWEGYADYKIVSVRVATSIDKALDAYSRIDGAHSEGAKVSPELAAEARARIMSAALKLIPEMQQDRESVDLYAQILERWQGNSGFIQQFNDLSLRDECPGWLFQMMLDIRRAGWELGYLQAGRTAQTDPEDAVEAQAERMVK